MANHDTVAPGGAQGSLLRDSDGSAYVEYLILVGFFALIVAAGILILGKPLLSLYQHIQLVWAGPFP